VLPLIAWLYAPVLARLFAVWMCDPFFSHGIFVPAFAGLVLWRDRKKLKAIANGYERCWHAPQCQLQLLPTAFGLLVNVFFSSSGVQMKQSYLSLIRGG